MTDMNDLEKRLARWHAAELDGEAAPAHGLDDPADAAFGAVFSAGMPEVRVPSDFASETMRVVGEVAAQDVRRATRARRILGIGSAAAIAVGLYFGAGPAVSWLSVALVAALDFLVAAVVWFASSADTRPDLWSVLASVGRAAGAFVSDPKVTLVLLALQGIAIAAFVALQRLLGAGPELYK
jgi:hypothetical protein